MKRILSFALSIIMNFMMIPTTVLAAEHCEITEGYYRIQHVGSAKYLDVDAGNLYNNGTQLQIWEKAEGNQNQVFAMIKDGKYWRIFSYPSGKIVEVVNSSHQAYARVQQYDDCGQKCGRWDIIYNNDGTVSFKNCESGLYLNVYANYTENGSKLVQYPHDGTTAEKFKLQRLTTEDVISAKWIRTFRTSEIHWSTNGGLYSNIINLTMWKHKNISYYPTPGYSYLASVEYLDPKTVFYMIKSRAYIDSAWIQIKEAVTSEATEEAISKALQALKIGNVPFLGTGLAILEILYNNEKNNEWNRFLDLVSYNEDTHSNNGIIIYTYETVICDAVYGPLANGTTQMGYRYFVKTSKKYEYYTWAGDNFGNVRYCPNEQTGYWIYKFK